PAQPHRGGEGESEHQPQCERGEGVADASRPHRKESEEGGEPRGGECVLPQRVHEAPAQRVRHHHIRPPFFSSSSLRICSSSGAVAFVGARFRIRTSLSTKLFVKYEVVRTYTGRGPEVSGRREEGVSHVRDRSREHRSAP